MFAKNEKELETLIQTARIYCRDIGMEFAIEKCALLIMRKGKDTWRMEWNYQIKKNQNAQRKGNA